jgi:hypothetical protein
MRNVRSALLVAAVGLMGLTACSFSSSRSWGSGNGSTANPNGIHGTGKPAQQSSGKPAKQVSNSGGKPAKQVPAPAPAPAAQPAPDPTPAPTPPAETKPTRVGRDDPPTTSPASQPTTNATMSAKAAKPDPVPPGVIEAPKTSTIGVSEMAKPANPGKIKAAPAKPKATDKVAAPN